MRTHTRAQALIDALHPYKFRDSYISSIFCLSCGSQWSLHYIVDEKRAFCVRCTKCSTTMKMILERIGRMVDAAAVASNKPIRHPQHAIIQNDFISLSIFRFGPERMSRWWRAGCQPKFHNSVYVSNSKTIWIFISMEMTPERVRFAAYILYEIMSSHRTRNYGRIFCRRNELWPRITHKHTSTQTRLHVVWDSKRNCVRTLSASLQYLWCGCRCRFVFLFYPIYPII